MRIDKIFEQYYFDEHKAEQDGITNRGGIFLFTKKNCQLGIYVNIRIYLYNYIDINVYDIDTNEEYTLFEVKNAVGGFVGDVRLFVDEFFNFIKNRYFVSRNIKEKILEYALDKYNSVGDKPFENDDNSLVLRCDNNKWYALIMSVSYKKFGYNIEDMVDCMNIKLSPESIDKYVDNKYFFPAYHMNKKYWISVLLVESLPLDITYKLLDESYNLVSKK